MRQLEPGNGECAYVGMSYAMSRRMMMYSVLLCARLIRAMRPYLVNSYVSAA